MFQDKGNFQKYVMFLTMVYLTFYFIFVIFRQFPTFLFGLDHSGSQPFIYCVHVYSNCQICNNAQEYHIYTIILQVLMFCNSDDIPLMSPLLDSHGNNLVVESPVNWVVWYSFDD